MDAHSTQNSTADTSAKPLAAGQPAPGEADHPGTPDAVSTAAGSDASSGDTAASGQQDGSADRGEKPKPPRDEGALTAEQEAAREQVSKERLARIHDEIAQSTALRQSERAGENREGALAPGKTSESPQNEGRALGAFDPKTGKREFSAHPILDAINGHQAKYIEKLRKLLHSHGIGVPDMDDFDPKGATMAPLKP